MKMFCLGAAWLLASLMAVQAWSPRYFLVYFGTYTGAKSKGIYFSRFDSVTGKLGSPELAAETKSPSFLAVHPNQHFLYAVGEATTLKGSRCGGVSAFALDQRTGKLSFLNQRPSGGLGPCHLAVDRSGRCLLVANYGGGSIASLPIRKDGSLGEPASTIQHTGSSVNPQRQAGPHAHCITPDPANRFALCCDLGLDQVVVYRLDAKRATLAATTVTNVRRGVGPRHLVFRPDGKFVFVVNEMASSLTAFAYDARRGVLREVETVSTLPAGIAVTNNSCAEVQMHPSGNFVYASNRGHDSIAGFGVDAKSGRLTLVENAATLGQTPRHFTLDPSGQWLLAENQASDSVVMFRVDPASGKPAPTGERIEVPAPVCAVFVPAQ